MSQYSNQLINETSPYLLQHAHNPVNWFPWGDEALKKAKEIIVHAYTDGRAPGLKRVNDLGLDAIVFPAPGTSEDIAMLIAYEYKAELIVA